MELLGLLTRSSDQAALFDSLFSPPHAPVDFDTYVFLHAKVVFPFPILNFHETYQSTIRTKPLHNGFVF